MRKLLALLLYIFIVFPLILATLVVASVSTWVLDREFYTDLLGDTRLYEVLLSEDLPNYLNRRVVREADSLPAKALGDALREVVTPEYLRTQALNIVNDAFDFAEGRDYTLDLYLDAQPIKDALRSEGGTRFARVLAASLPTCASGQESLARGATLPRCLPSSISVDQAADMVVAALPAFLDKVPDRIQLSDRPIDMRRELRGAEIWAGLAGTNSLTVAIVILVFISGSFWYISALLAGEDRRERLMWLGWMLIVPAILVFMIGLAVNTDVASGWVSYGLNQARFEGVEYSLAFRQALIDVARDALNTVASGFLAVGGVAGAIALALVVWGGSVPPERRLAPAMVAAAR
ncbi:MAG TPA: hypothetical protein VJ754_08975, partial [Anaerolineae bacterium]|nr:hypothetical protein [Anaerolineae bacterium]